MVYLYLCGACERGDHAHCEKGDPAPPGMCGGSKCRCMHVSHSALPKSDETAATPKQVFICAFCDWVNINLLNIADLGSQAKWICHTCVKRQSEGLTAKTSELEAMKRAYDLERECHNHVIDEYRLLKEQREADIQLRVKLIDILHKHGTGETDEHDGEKIDEMVNRIVAELDAARAEVADFKARYENSVVASADYARTRNETIARLTSELAAAKRDGELEYLERNCLTLECVSVGFQDDADIEWHVVSYHMAEPRDRIIGHGSSPLIAISEARKAQP